jgi:hypothetical protein
VSASDETAEVFVTAFKSLKRHQREAVLKRMLADAELSEDLADSVELEARRGEDRQPFSRGKRMRLTASQIHAHLDRICEGVSGNCA